jgi:hypothetical protein
MAMVNTSARYPDALWEVVPLILEIEAAGVELAVEGRQLLARPDTKLSADHRARLKAQYAPVVALLRTFDDGVKDRRTVFEGQIAAAGDRVVLPLLTYRPDLAYVADRCWSCGDALERPTFGRCWRCSVAWRLAAGVQVPELAHALDGAKAV